MYIVFNLINYMIQVFNINEAANRGVATFLRPDEENTFGDYWSKSHR